MAARSVGAVLATVVAVSLLGCAPSVVHTEPACRPAPGEQYATSGFEPHEVEVLPYARTVETALALDDPRYEVDADGRLQQPWEGHDDGVYHPVHLAMYSLYQVESYRAGAGREHLDRAIINATQLLDGTEDIDGALFFGYHFDHRLKGDDAMALSAPWYSGMAQGQALSLFVRLHEVTGDEQWQRAAELTFASFGRDHADGVPGFTLTTDAGCLWFEEYVGDGLAPTHIVNGHIYAVFGLYDYAVLTGDPDAVRLFDAGATTTLQTFGSYRRPGLASYYCAARYCAQTSWQPEDYHRGVTQQLRDLAAMTDDERFTARADLLQFDYEVTGATE